MKDNEFKIRFKKIYFEGYRDGFKDSTNSISLGIQKSYEQMNELFKKQLKEFDDELKAK